MGRLMSAFAAGVKKKVYCSSVRSPLLDSIARRSENYGILAGPRSANRGEEHEVVCQDLWRCQWSSGQALNLHLVCYEQTALTLSYQRLERPGGFEPPFLRWQRRVMTVIRRKQLERPVGIAPTLSAWKACFYSRWSRWNWHRRTDSNRGS